MIRGAAACAGLVLLATAPAVACVPIVSVGMGGVFVGYLVWLVLTMVLGWRYAFARSSGRWYALAVPIGLFAFSVPTLGIFAVPFVVLYLAFPMHLAVEFFRAFFWYVDDSRLRAWRLVYFGFPLLTMLALGVGAKWMLYAEGGGLREFMWNYSGGNLVFMAICILIGFVAMGLAGNRGASA